MNKTSEIVLVLDRSGSMETCWSDAIKPTGDAAKKTRALKNRVKST